MRSTRFRFQTLALLFSAFFDHFFVSGEGLLGVLRAAGTAVRLAELKIGEVAVRPELFSLLEAGDGAVGVALLQQGAAELEVSQLVVRLGLDDVAQQGCRVLRMAE